jgi:hypothetical protein
MRNRPLEKVTPFLACAAIIACSPIAAPAVVQVTLDQIPAMASELDGRQVQISGIVFMKEDSRNVVSSRNADNNFCVGLLVTETEFQALKRFDGKRATVTGLFDKEGCGGLTICHDSCGPYAMSDLVISE